MFISLTIFTNSSAKIQNFIHSCKFSKNWGTLYLFALALGSDLNLLAKKSLKEHFFELVGELLRAAEICNIMRHNYKN